jgi:hypothetical protein
MWRGSNLRPVDQYISAGFSGSVRTNCMLIGEPIHLNHQYQNLPLAPEEERSRN